MQQRHKDHNRYFNEQAECMRRYVIPYIEQAANDYIKTQSHNHIKQSQNTQQRNTEPWSLAPEMRVLEIGCGEAGNLKPFLDMGCECVGIDIDEPKIEVGKTRFADHPYSDRIHLICNDIYKVKPKELGEFDLIILRDVIEHIPHQEVFMHDMKRFMNDHTMVFFGFPVWHNPFGGHQQICKSKVLSHLPWMHLLPRPLYKGLLRFGGESQGTIDGLMDVKTTGISIHRFERILRDEHLQVLKHTHYLINPNYEIKFGLRPRVVPRMLQIPYLSDFYTTAMYYVVRL